MSMMIAKNLDGGGDWEGMELQGKMFQGLIFNAAWRMAHWTVFLLS